MNILWSGGEDIDFTAGASPYVSTGGQYRTTWTRCAVESPSNSVVLPKGNAWPGGSVTSCWLSARTYLSSGMGSGGFLGLGNTSSGSSGAGLWIGISSGNANPSKTALFSSTNGSSFSSLATESGNSITMTTLHRWDMQVTSFGASATVNVYLDGVLIINWSGSLSGLGITNLNSVMFYCPTSGGAGGYQTYVSEVIVADSDTRSLLGLQTLPLGAAGYSGSQNWSNNTYTNINGVSFSDASPTYVNTTAQDQAYKTTSETLPSVYSVVAVVQSARIAASSASTPTHVKLGYNNGSGSASFGTGSTTTPVVAFQSYIQIDQTNPITGVAFTSTDIAAPLQLDLQSA